MRYLAIIPARGGSKGIPNKNIAIVGGKPLIAWTIEASLNSRYIEHIIISTDSEKIALVAAQHGMQPISLRPTHLAEDETPSIDVIRYEIQRYEAENEPVDAVLLLQPTTPLRTAQDIDTAIEIFEKSDKPSLISVYDATSVHPRIMYTSTENGTLQTFLPENNKPQRRQDFEHIFIRNGAIYISRRNLIMNENKLICQSPAYYEMPEERSINIDKKLDMVIADYLLSANK